MSGPDTRVADGSGGPDGLMARLARLDTCAVSDALDRLGLAGVVTGLGQLSVPGRRICGRAVTVELGPPATAVAGRHLGTAAIDAASSGDIIVVAHQGRVDCAGWGGILSLAAQLRGVAGVVVDGACRDLDEARELAFPVFARSAVPTTARNRAAEVAWGGPIIVGDGVTVEPGDLVLADGSGVVFVTADLAAAVVDAAEDIFAREAAMAAALRAGGRAAEVMGRSYEELLRG